MKVDAVRAGQVFAHLFGSLFYNIMCFPMSINNIKKPRGRPKVASEAVMVRMSATLLESLDAHIAKRKEPIGRPEAIRRLVELGLKKGRKV